MSWRRIMYNLMYRFGAPRWDTGITPPEVVAVTEGAAALLGLVARWIWAVAQVPI